jgi:hypothetical protein
MQPLGWPVVPEVKKIAARGSVGDCQEAAAAGRGVGSHQSNVLADDAQAGRWS